MGNKSNELVSSTDEAIKKYRKELKKRVEGEQDEVLNEMPDEKTLRIIDEILYAQARSFQPLLDELNSEIEKVRNLVAEHEHIRNSEAVLKVKDIEQ